MTVETGSGVFCQVMRKRNHRKFVTFATDFDVLLTVHLSTFISVINQIDAHIFILK